MKAEQCNAPDVSDAGDFCVIQVKMKGRLNERKKSDYRKKGILKKYW